MSNYSYDPGEPYDGPPPEGAGSRRARRDRRAYRRETDSDDAWAAADEDADADGGGVEGLAAGYDWRDDPQYGIGRRPPAADHVALGPLPPEAERARRRVEGPRQERIRRRLDRAGVYPESPSFQRDSRMGPVEVEPYLAATRPPGPPSGQPPGRDPRKPQPVPFLGILLLVILGMIALGAVILACVAVLVWL